MVGYCKTVLGDEQNLPRCEVDRFDLSPVNTIQPVVKPVVQPGCTTRFDNRLNEQLFVQHGCQTGCQTRLTAGLTTVGCLFTQYNRLSNRLYNRFDNRLYRVNGVLEC